ncbi:hypothetical protein A2631_02710 [Candidatus Daviesbacteria bacterium RIFCSPHIGHO2_01_FULL_44_29]|uniref:O-antigen ligase-related domain-containing protein n=1 Tax=Candidatus Daviesbacteria bacterium RIFCSPHIGHO2_02_FULL_43_12 TaxID=1797776 RepID=A0A1F5KK32_9BACT|nr:MAG: hypothetical protein A2631_02710 [Candidatus Daviesbacteria bacterium RIFCSPHIGHO2_01_FULL_44_29]OGE40848.1 MAG: hypothetical protein A3E86_02640 [Candidatus Daviesbacteria bacterium RIFCSPHIGHO2_12_FULL_47_45]OGE41296.1 MAG: hypothetical protein A3D25_02105 [Candidatus Daviesbacteria bacterium RIFCSPHIGHO2_02_FULL_43_12]OGE69497.1 MAG: hypothetical protein A3B55_03845 [Candidatus Daviesbacteria bacterium RIFCSPLOWO2_01_FULL_43_15]
MHKLSDIFKNLSFWLLLFLVVFIPLYPKIPLFSVQNTFAAIRLEDLVIAFSLVVWSLYILFSRQVKKFVTLPVNQIVGVFLLIGILSSFSGIFLTHTALPHLAVLHFLRRVELVPVLCFSIFIIQHKRQLLIVLWTLFITSVLVNVYALGQAYLHWPVIATTNSEFAKGQILYLSPGARVSSTFAGHYDLPVFLVMVMSIFIALFFYFKNTALKLLTGLGCLFCFIILVMNAARLSFAALVVGIIILLVLLKKRMLIALLLLVVVLGAAYPSQLRDRLVSTIMVNFRSAGDTYNPKNNLQEQRSKLNIPTLPISKDLVNATKFSTPSGGVAPDVVPGEPTDPTQLGVYRSGAIRLNYEWPLAIRAFMKNPFLGTGYSSLGLATDNDFLRSLGETGVLGSLAFFFLITRIVRDFWKGYQDKDQFTKILSAGMLIMVFCFVTNGLVIDVFEASKIATLFWLISGTYLGYLYQRK